MFSQVAVTSMFAMDSVGVHTSYMTQALATTDDAVLDAEIVWDADYAGPLPTDWTFEQATEATTAINGLAANFADEWQTYMLDAYYHRVWKGLGYDSWDDWRSKLATMKLSPSDRKAMARKAKELGFSTREVASMQGVSQATASRDVRDEEPAPEPKANQFICDSCGKAKLLTKRVEWDGETYCEPCAAALEEAVEYGEGKEQSEGAAEHDTSGKAEADDILVSQMTQVAKIAAKTPWTLAATKRIIKLATQIQKDMEEING